MANQKGLFKAMMFFNEASNRMKEQTDNKNGSDRSILK